MSPRQLNTAISRASEIEEKLNSLQSEKEDVVKENEKLVEVTEKLRQNEVQLDAKRKYLEQKCKDLQLRIESLDIQSKSLEADKKNLETTLKEALVAEKFEGRKALANELKEELGVLLTAYRSCPDVFHQQQSFLRTEIKLNFLIYVYMYNLIRLFLE